MAEVSLVKEVAVKQSDGTMGSYYKIGSNFSEIIDARREKGNYTLEQFFDNYMDFIQNTTFIYAGIEEPLNPHIGIWLDTGHTNHDTFGER